MFFLQASLHKKSVCEKKIGDFIHQVNKHSTVATITIILCRGIHLSRVFHLATDIFITMNEQMN